MDSMFDSFARTAMDAVATVYGEAIRYRVQDTGQEFDIQASAFDESSAVVETAGEVAVQTLKPVASIRVTDLERLGIQPRGEDLIRRLKTGRDYRVVDVIPDGRAEVRLVLHRYRNA